MRTVWSCLLVLSQLIVEFLNLWLSKLECNIINFNILVLNCRIVYHIFFEKPPWGKIIKDVCMYVCMSRLLRVTGDQRERWGKTRRTSLLLCLNLSKSHSTCMPALYLSVLRFNRGEGEMWCYNRATFHPRAHEWLKKKSFLWSE